MRPCFQGMARADAWYVAGIKKRPENYPGLLCGKQARVLGKCKITCFLYGDDGPEVGEYKITFFQVRHIYTRQG